MSRYRFRMAVGISAAVFLLTGCFIGYNLYRLKAKKWKEQIEKAGSLVTEVQNAAGSAGINALSPEFRSANMPKLDDAKSILLTVQSEMEATNPPGGKAKEAHEALKSGVAAFIDAITAISDGLTLGDPSKKDIAMQKKAEAEGDFAKAKQILMG